MARNPITPYRGGGLLGGGFDPLFSLHREMNRLFDEAIGGGMPASPPGAARQIISAQMNVSEIGNEIRVEAELPGVREDDIDVSLDDDILTIRGEKRMERKEEKESFHFVERSFGTFQRSVRLPFPVDAEKVQAEFENGVLTVTLPRSAQQERTRRIQVQRGERRQIGQAAQDQGSRHEGQMQAGRSGEKEAGGQQPRDA